MVPLFDLLGLLLEVDRVVKHQKVGTVEIVSARLTVYKRYICECVPSFYS